jgi:hypothetical protein
MELRLVSSLLLERLVPEAVAFAGFEAGAVEVLELVECFVEYVGAAALPAVDEAADGGDELSVRRLGGSVERGAWQRRGGRRGGGAAGARFNLFF